MRRALGTVGLIVSAAVGYWVYTSKRDTGVWPSFSDFWEVFQSVIRRQYVVLTGTVNDVTNQIQGNPSNYVELATTTVAKFEGFSPRAYRDASGYSIGYGHFIRQGDGLSPSSVLTEHDGFALLQLDIADAVNCCESAITAAVTDNMMAACISLAYNIGCGAFKSSTLLKLLNQGDYEGASAQFGVWKFSQGAVLEALVNRRAAEQELFNS